MRMTKFNRINTFWSVLNFTFHYYILLKILNNNSRLTAKEILGIEDTGDL